jgi:hypothetical protein
MKQGCKLRVIAVLLGSELPNCTKGCLLGVFTTPLGKLKCALRCMDYCMWEVLVSLSFGGVDPPPPSPLKPGELCGVQVISRQSLEAMADAVPQALVVLQSIVLRSTCLNERQAYEVLERSSLTR